MSTVSPQQARPHKRWMPPALRAAGLYNLVWAGLMLALPGRVAGWMGQPGNRPDLLQGMGMLIGVLGLGYLLAAADPYRHWPVSAMGLVSKGFGFLGFLGGIQQGLIKPDAWWMAVLNDLIWIAPFSLILYGSYDGAQADRARNRAAVGATGQQDAATTPLDR